MYSIACKQYCNYKKECTSYYWTSSKNDVGKLSLGNCTLFNGYITKEFVTYSNTNSECGIAIYRTKSILFSNQTEITTSTTRLIKNSLNSTTPPTKTTTTHIFNPNFTNPPTNKSSSTHHSSSSSITSLFILTGNFYILTIKSTALIKHFIFNYSNVSSMQYINIDFRYLLFQYL